MKWIIFSKVRASGWVVLASVAVASSLNLLAEQGPVSVTTYAGTEQGSQDGYRTKASFFALAGLQKDAYGRIWVTEAYFLSFWDAGYGAQRIRVIDTDGLVTTFAGSEEPGLVEGPAAQARFRGPSKLVFDAEGNAFVTDRLNHRIRKIDTAGMVSTFAGSSEGFKDGPGLEAKFYMPIGLAIDTAQNLYVSDFGNTLIRKITPQGMVSTIAGSVPGASDGPVATATFNGPNDVAVAADGTLFVSDWANGRVRKISEGIVSTIARGLPYNHTVTVAPDGNLIVVCGGCVSMMKMTTDGEILWSYQPARGFLDGPAESAQFGGFLYDALVLPGGDILTIDGSNYRIRRLIMQPSPPTIEGLIKEVQALLPIQAQRPLLATLGAASRALNRGQIKPAINTLEAFQSKVGAQVGGSAPEAAAQLIEQAAEIIASLQ